jgi:hypothetical protein
MIPVSLSARTTWPELAKQRRAIDGKPDDFEA